MPFHIVRDDIANMRTDAVIVPANANLLIGGGAGESVARIAGTSRLQAACDKIGGCAVGKAAVTPAFDFPAKMIVHAVGPVWKGGESGEAEALYSCVCEALLAASGAGAQTMALPLLSTGAYRYPSGLAIDIETRAIRDFLDDHEADVWLVLFDRMSMSAGRLMFDSISEYIDDVYVGENECAGTRTLSEDIRALEDLEIRSAQSMYVEVPDQRPVVYGNLADRLDRLDESFAQMVLRLIDERGMTDVEVYKRANMSRQLFAKIRKDDDYRPAKKTACALAFALELNYDDAAALLGHAGFALSYSSKFDIIVEYFLVHGIYDIFQVNEALFAYDQQMLG